MFNVIGSRQWIFDRCVQGASIYLLLVLIVSAGLSLSLFFIFRTLLKRKPLFKRKFSNLSKALLILFGTAFFIPIVFGISFFVSIFNCSSWDFFESIGAAHKIHAIMKNNYKTGLGWPKSESELSVLDPKDFSIVKNNAKTRYVYDPNTRSYTWFVRPSAYQVVVFDDKRDFVIYTLSNLFNFSETRAHYPPSYPGPWNQLPQ